jgi:hypothetical protein
MQTDALAVQVFPIAQPTEWREFCESVATGERAEAHRAMLSRLGISCERIFHQKAGDTDIAVIVWEGIDQEHAAKKMGELVASPQSDHERYLLSHVIRELHGVDPMAGPPPVTTEIATIDIERVTV